MWLRKQGSRYRKKKKQQHQAAAAAAVAARLWSAYTRVAQVFTAVVPSAVSAESLQRMQEGLAPYEASLRAHECKQRHSCLYHREGEQLVPRTAVTRWFNSQAAILPGGRQRRRRPRGPRENFVRGATNRGWCIGKTLYMYSFWWTSQSRHTHKCSIMLPVLPAPQNRHSPSNRFNMMMTHFSSPQRYPSVSSNRPHFHCSKRWATAFDRIENSSVVTSLSRMESYGHYPVDL